MQWPLGQTETKEVHGLHYLKKINKKSDFEPISPGRLVTSDEWLFVNHVVHTIVNVDYGTKAWCVKKYQ